MTLHNPLIKSDNHILLMDNLYHSMKLLPPIDLFDLRFPPEYNGIPHKENKCLRNLPGEEWRPVAGYEGLYEVSNLGRIKGLPREVINPVTGQRRFMPERIRCQFLRKEYCSVELSKDSVNKKYPVHRLVAIEFIPNPENKPDVNHKRGIRRDCRVTAIEWVTKSENRIHAIMVLKVRLSGPKWERKEDHPMYGKRGILSPNYGKRGALHHGYGKTGALCKTSKPIICNETGVEFAAIADAARQMNIGASCIGRSLRGLSGPAKGHTFRYKNDQAVEFFPKARCKKIICVTNGKEYSGLTEAAVELNLQVSKISCVLNGKRNHTRGYVFHFADGDLKPNDAAQSIE